MNVHRIEIGTRPGLRDARGEAAASGVRGFLGLPVDRIESRDIYKIMADLTPDEVEAVRREFTDPIAQVSSVGHLPAAPFDWALTVGFLPGVTDNVGRTSRSCVQDIIGRVLTVDEAVFTETCYLIWGPRLRKEDVEAMGRDLLANGLIQSIQAESFQEWGSSPASTQVPLAGAKVEACVRTFDLSGTDEELMRLSRDGILGLSIEEMHALRDHVSSPEIMAERQRYGLVGSPTDVEIEAIAQTWSEHCKHKIFNARITYVDEQGRITQIDSLFDTYIRRATEELAADRDWLLSVFHDNAGVIRYNEKWLLAYKVETHNSPSALDPYGGAMTGIVGVNRDPFGTGKGAKLIGNVWGYCLGSPFYDKPVPAGLLHPRRIRDGVHKGVIDGGNQSGIPYCRGWEIFDDRYLGKPLVYCGTLGLIPATVRGAPGHTKKARPGDVIIMVGGRIGKDGIHGATFSSEELHAASPSHAVQIGDPITQRKMTDFLLEARDLGLYACITDNGAGGLSSSVGEMAQDSGGCDMDLALAPLKYEGLQPWEILLSEAQERMTVAVPPEDQARFLDLAKRRDVEATVLGVFTDTGYYHVRYGDRGVAHLSLDFLHHGLPTLSLDAVWTPPVGEEPPSTMKPASPSEALRGLLASLNLCSGETKARQYDHEVKGRSVIKPYVGRRRDVPSDGTILLADLGGREGIVLTEAVNPHLSDLDAYQMAVWVVDLAMRRYVASGGDMALVAGLDNFCWPDPIQSDKTPDGRYKLAQLVRANQGLYDAVKAFGAPLISGKDSMKNDSTRGGVKISIPPTLLFSVVGKIQDVAKAMTLTPKGQEDLLYVVGETSPDLGCSEYYRWLGEARQGRAFVGAQIARPDLRALVLNCKAVEKVVAQGLCDACHAPGKGGLAVGFARMAMAGEIGMELDLALAPGCRDMELAAALFSETPGRFLMSVPQECASGFEKAISSAPWARVGRLSPGRRWRARWGQASPVMDEDLLSLKEIWKEPLRDL